MTPKGADACLLKMIIHDWDDERSIAILRHCREAMAPGGTLLLVERVTPERIEARHEHEPFSVIEARGDDLEEPPGRHEEVRHGRTRHP